MESGPEPRIPAFLVEGGRAGPHPAPPSGAICGPDPNSFIHSFTHSFVYSSFGEEFFFISDD